MVLVTLDVVTIVIYIPNVQKYCSVCIYMVNDQYKVRINLCEPIQCRYVDLCAAVFFFCLVCTVACYTLSRKKKNMKIHGGFGSTWGDNFYMGTQNGSKLEI